MALARESSPDLAGATKFAPPPTKRRERTQCPIVRFFFSLPAACVSATRPNAFQLLADTNTLLTHKLASAVHNPRFCRDRAHDHGEALASLTVFSELRVDPPTAASKLLPASLPLHPPPSVPPWTTRHPNIGLTAACARQKGYPEAVTLLRKQGFDRSQEFL